jgi:hypothetical protein
MTSSAPTPNPASPAWDRYVDGQNVTLIGPGGSPVVVTLTQLDESIYFILEIVASYAFSIGVTGILMIVLLVQIDRKKARRPIWILNFISLFFSCLRGIIYVADWLSRWGYGIGERLFGLMAQYNVGELRFINVFGGGICPLIIFAAILASLVLQVRVVFAAQPTTQIFITIILSLGSLLTYGALFAYICWELKLVFGYHGVFNNFTTLFRIWNIAFIVVVGICCSLFLYKLFVTIRRRSGMGFQSFGPLHVLAIMFGQCLVIPRMCPRSWSVSDLLVVLLIIQEAYANDRFSLIEITLTLLVASLPLSTLWASHIAEAGAQQVHTTSSSVTTSSGLSHRLKNFKVFGNKKHDGQASLASDPEKASHLSDLEAGKWNNSLDVSQLSPSFEMTDSTK